MPCTKVAFSSPQQAERERIRIIREGRNITPVRGVPLSVYRCDHCQHWHLGHDCTHVDPLHVKPRRPEHRKNWRHWRATHADTDE